MCCSGGKPHNLACDHYIQGFYGSHGNGLDQIGVLCEDGNSKKMAASNVANPYIKTCDSAYLVTGFKVSTGWVKRQKGLASFSLKYENIDSIKANDNSDFYCIHSLFEDREKTFEWNCPAQTVASVIKGRSDSVINSFGLNCRGI